MLRRRTSSGAKPFGRYGIDADGRPAGLQPLRRDSNGLAPSRLEAIASAGAMPPLPSPSRNTVTWAAAHGAWLLVSQANNFSSPTPLLTIYPTHVLGSDA